jgi:hypothetical protein
MLIFTGKPPDRPHTATGVRQVRIVGDAVVEGVRMLPIGPE